MILELTENIVKCSERVVNLHEATLEEKMKLASEQNGNCIINSVSKLTEGLIQ